MFDKKKRMGPVPTGDDLNGADALCVSYSAQMHV